MRLKSNVTVIGIVVTAAVFLLMATVIIGSAITTYHEDKLWNDGYCTCGGQWEYEQGIGHKYSTSFIYVCNKCGKRAEFNKIR